MRSRARRGLAARNSPESSGKFPTSLRLVTAKSPRRWRCRAGFRARHQTRRHTRPVRKAVRQRRLASAVDDYGDLRSVGTVCRPHPVTHVMQVTHPYRSSLPRACVWGLYREVRHVRHCVGAGNHGTPKFCFVPRRQFNRSSAAVIRRWSAVPIFGVSR
jgi:hypothetical protein